ncbi:MAG TPA: hypothetical protein DHV28_01035 [Ignavibacteriales bacterium]|nr:hypothetical protein [Ignavibacteriales bacterium]
MIKHTTKMFALLFVFASIVLFISCQEQQSVVNPDAGQSLSKETILTLDPGVTVVSAKLVLYQFIGNGQLNQIHRVTAPWLENTVTWNNFAGAYDPAVSGSFVPAPAKDDDTIHVDVTALVQGWASCSYDNNGLLIDQLSTDPTFERSLFYSKENTNPTLGERAPYLIVVLSNGTTVEVTTIADAYINSHPPNDTTNYGSSVFLNDGYLDGYEKQALVKFDIQCTPPLVEHCETAYAKASNGECFLSLSPISANNWGWTNQITGSGSWDWPIYAGAGQCDVTKGTLVGELHVSYNGTTVTIEYDLDAGYTLSETHVWVGTTKLPIKKGIFVTAPGQFNNNGVNPVQVNIAAPFYIAAHAGVCWFDEQ